MSSSEASSSDSEFETPAQDLPQRGTKGKDAFDPPHGAVLIGGPDDDAGAIEMGEFDWNSVKDDKNIELWLIRVPNSVSPFLGDSSPLPLPSPSLVTSSGPTLHLSLRFLPLDEALERWLLSNLFRVSRSNPNILMTRFLMLPPHRPRIPLARSRKNTRYMTYGLSVTATTKTLIATRSVGTR